MLPTMIDPTADVHELAIIGQGTRIWHLAQIREGARLGAGCIIGRGAYVGTGVEVGDYSKIQNFALVYEPAWLGPGVFIGPAAVLTNDQYPRAVNPDLSQKSAHDWDPVGVRIEEGAAIGARAVCVAPVQIGAWSLVAAGSVVINDVPPFALVAGVPARRVRWVGHAGVPLDRLEDELWVCPQSGRIYRQIDEDTLVPVTAEAIQTGIPETAPKETP